MNKDDASGYFERPKGSMPRIKSIWAFLVVDPKDENEGIISMTRDGLMMPLIASDRVRLDQLRPYAQRVADQIGRPVQLVEFVQRVELETIEPAAPGP
jgi:hypothetical protein